MAARVAADGKAREATVSTLLPMLTEDVRPGQDTDVRMIDIGAGSGANQRWLAPRLPFRQHWVHLDHDPAILTHTHGVAPTEFVVGGIGALGALLDHHRERGTAQPDVITCAAVLDVLTRSDLALLCDLISSSKVPALLSLSVTGELAVEPPDGADAALLEAFNDHQRRDGRAGPDAPDLVGAQCGGAGARVESVSTPWVLDGTSDRAFVARFLQERIDASLEQEPTLRTVGEEWLRRRLAALVDLDLRITVGHRDLLILPS